MRIYSLLTVSILSLIILSSCDLPPPDQPAAIWESIQFDIVTDNVENYMKYTLGSIPRANIDYEQAKKLLTPDFAAQFTTPMFIPATYCIQDGPTDVQVTTVTFNEEYNWANVTVEGAYKGGWMKMWDFTVVPVEGDDWMIHKIECSDEML
ncbi:MAG: hypothetical protein KAS32_01870 [Candidatus Peribacteraceae bacterium]|nr:hypothetical protein [Candidatus Peribacteraceae bacterium]